MLSFLIEFYFLEILYRFLASLESRGVTVQDIMTPLVERVKRRVDEISQFFFLFLSFHFIVVILEYYWPDKSSNLFCLTVDLLGMKHV